MPDVVQLFRFSAITFNPHRIHYDRTYAMEVEGYPDLSCTVLLRRNVSSTWSAI